MNADRRHFETDRNVQAAALRRCHIANVYARNRQSLFYFLLSIDTEAAAMWKS